MDARCHIGVSLLQFAIFMREYYLLIGQTWEVGYIDVCAFWMNVMVTASYWISSHTHVLLHSTRCMFTYVTYAPLKDSWLSRVSYIEFTVGFMGSVWLLSESWPMRNQDLEISLFRLRDLPIWLSGIWVFSQLLFNVFLSHYWNTEDILSEQPQLLGDISHFAVMTLPDEFVTVCECKNQLFGFLPSFPSLMYCLMPLSKVCYLILFLILLLFIFTFGYSLPCMNFAVEDEKECIHWTITMPTRVCITFFFFFAFSAVVAGKNLQSYSVERISMIKEMRYYTFPLLVVDLSIIKFTKIF